MDRDKIIDGLKMTRDLCVFDPSTGEEIEPHLLNDINRATYDACKGALEILERLDTDSDIISRQAVLDALNNIEIPRNASWYQYYQQALTAVDKLPPAQPERIIHCKDCKHHWKHKCMDSMSIEKCDLGQTFYDAEVDYCSLAERRKVTE